MRLSQQNQNTDHILTWNQWEKRLQAKKVEFIFIMSKIYSKLSAEDKHRWKTTRKWNIDLHDPVYLSNHYISNIIDVQEKYSSAIKKAQEKLKSNIYWRFHNFLHQANINERMQRYVKVFEMAQAYDYIITESIGLATTLFQSLPDTDESYNQVFDTGFYHKICLKLDIKSNDIPYPRLQNRIARRDHILKKLELLNRVKERCHVVGSFFTSNEENSKLIKKRAKKRLVERLGFRKPVLSSDEMLTLKSKIQKVDDEFYSFQIYNLRKDSDSISYISSTNSVEDLLNLPNIQNEQTDTEITSIFSGKTQINHGNLRKQSANSNNSGNLESCPKNSYRPNLRSLIRKVSIFFGGEGNTALKDNLQAISI